MGTGQAATGGPLARSEASELIGEGQAGIGLAAGDLGANLHRVLLALGTVPVPEGNRETGAIGCPALSKARAELDEALGPDGEVGSLILESDVSVAEHTLEGADIGPVGRPQGTGGAIEKLATVPHRAPNDPQAIRRVDHHLEPAVIVPRDDIPTIDPVAAPPALQLDLEGVGALLPSHLTAGPESIRAATDERRGVLGPKRAAPCQKADRLEEGGLALGVPPVKDVQAGVEVYRHVPYVAEIVDDEVSQPDQAWSSRSAWA